MHNKQSLEMVPAQAPDNIIEVQMAFAEMIQQLTTK